MSSDKDDVCGISKLWAFPIDDAFTPACVLHDKAYIENEIKPGTRTRKEVDREFLRNMLAFSNNSRWLKLKAYTLYGIVRIFGGLFW